MKSGDPVITDQPGLSSILDPKRWLILAVLGLAQLMVVLDSTIVNIALPSTQAALGFSTADRQWVITARRLKDRWAPHCSTPLPPVRGHFPSHPHAIHQAP